MKTSAFRLACLLSALITAGTTVESISPSADPDLQQLAGYRQWQRLTEKPIPIGVGSAGG